jgi:hypothetical protein
LNDRLGSTFPETSHFSKPLSGYELTGIAQVCADRGITLDKAATSMAKIRKAIRTGKAMTTQGATLIAGLGYRNGNTLTTASQCFVIAPHNGHDCIRISVNGQRVRFRLDALAALFSEAGLGPNVSATYLLRSRIADVAPEPEIDPLEFPEEASGATSTGETGATSTGDCEVGLSGRIAALCQPDRRAPVIDDATDPLEL